MDFVSLEEVKAMLIAGKTYRCISEELKALYPQKRGFSERSVRRFVAKRNLKKICCHEKLYIVNQSIREVGSLYGRKMMKGYLASKGASISERDLKKHLPLLSPQWHSARHQFSSERSNPPIYTSHYFGHKLHVDQNEKLVQYGVTYVLARDGYSGKIVGQAIMAVKNNAIIYEHVYRTCTLEYGLWDEIRARVDHGKEFYLLLYMHEQLRNEGRGNPDVSPYLQTSSTANHIIERIWVEVNQRVTYPIKRVVIIMDDCRLINMENSVDKYCVSVVLRRICMVGLQRMINAWNSHSVPRKGIPNVLQSQNNGTTPMDPADVPSVDNAVAAYREQGGSLTDPHEFGSDPLKDDATLLQQREDDWLGMQVCEHRRSVHPTYVQ